MSDTYGASTLPLQAPTNGEAAGDPGLTRIAAYLKAVLNADAAAAVAAVIPGTVPVVACFTHDPEVQFFVEKSLPALYLFRTGGKTQRLSEDCDLVIDTLQLYWVFPPRHQEIQYRRAPLAAGLIKVIHNAIETGRHPAYVLSGDTDTRAADEGSVIYKVANIFSLELLSWDVGKLPIRSMDGGPGVEEFYRVGAKIELQEQRILDIVADFPAAGGLDLTIQTPDKGRDLAVGKL